jgi:hypothetical protein
LWLLVALGLPADAGAARRVPRIGWVAGAALAGSIAVACYVTALRPVLDSRRAMDRAAAEPMLAVQHLVEAAEADPGWADPWLALAAHEHARWLGQRDRGAIERFGRYAVAAARARPAASARLMIGDWHLAAARQERDERAKALFAQSAAEAYRQATACYPTSALAWARLAEAADLAGDEARKAAAATEALRLNELAHTQARLDAELADRLGRMQ